MSKNRLKIPSEIKVAPRYKLLTLLTLFKLLKLLYTAKILACMHIYIYLGKVRTLLELADGLLSKMLGDGWIGVDGYPLDTYG